MAGEAMTLLDYAASQKDNYLIKGFINAMMDDKSVGGIGLLDVIKWLDVDSLTAIIPRMVDEGGPAPTSRPINGTYNSGIAAPVEESISVGNIGQDVVIDLAFLKKNSNYINGLEPKALQTMYLAKRIKRLVNYKLMAGTKATDPNGFNGIKFFCDANQIIDMGSADVPNGAASYAVNGNNVWAAFTAQKGRDYVSGMDYLVEAVPGATHLIMNDQAKRALFISLRDSSTSGFFTTTKDSFDRTIDSYRGIPIINPGSQTAVKVVKQAVTTANAVHPNSVTYGSAPVTNATEIYAVRINSTDGVCGLQYNPLDVRTVADEMTQGPGALIRADWYPGLYRFKEDAIAKLVGMVVV